MRVKPLERQSLFDIAIQTSGDVEAVFALAVKNGLSITDDLLVDSEIHTVDVFDKIVVERYMSRGIRPATALVWNGSTPAPSMGGIGYMAIEIDFIIS